MEKSIQAYKDLRNRAKLKSNLANQGDGERAVMPYLYEFYNVFGFTQLASSGVRSVLARVINSLIEGLNERPQLPRYVVVMLDKDVIDEIDVWEPESAMIKAFNTVTS